PAARHPPRGLAAAPRRGRAPVLDGLQPPPVGRRGALDKPPPAHAQRAAARRVVPRPAARDGLRDPRHAVRAHQPVRPRARHGACPAHGSAGGEGHRDVSRRLDAPPRPQPAAAGGLRRSSRARRRYPGTVRLRPRHGLRVRAAAPARRHRRPPPRPRAPVASCWPRPTISRSAGQRPTPEEAMWDQVGRLYAHHGDVPAEVRLLKLTEEVGEAREDVKVSRTRTAPSNGGAPRTGTAPGGSGAGPRADRPPDGPATRSARRLPGIVPRPAAWRRRRRDGGSHAGTAPWPGPRRRGRPPRPARGSNAARSRPAAPPDRLARSPGRSRPADSRTRCLRGRQTWPSRPPALRSPQAARPGIVPR